MIIPFFLTRQTANLMEDFAREVRQGPALFLLYGEGGVGKTRLLQELCQSRFSERRIHWLDLGTGDSADGTRFDYSHGIEDLFGKAEEGDIIIADHFEEALKKTRHQLFLSWSSDGIDKKLCMIIGSSSDGFNELRQLSQHYQARVQSFQQMPFSADEVESFIGFCLFPDQPVAQLRIPGPIRKQLAATQGNVGRIIEIIEQQGKQVKWSSASASEPESIRQGSKIIAAVLVLFVVAIGAGWFYSQGPLAPEAETTAAIPAVPASESPPAAATEAPATEPPVIGAQAESTAAAAPLESAGTVAAAVDESDDITEPLAEDSRVSGEPVALAVPLSSEAAAQPDATAELESAGDAIAETNQAADLETASEAAVEATTAGDDDTGTAAAVATDEAGEIEAAGDAAMEAATDEEVALDKGTPGGESAAEIYAGLDEIEPGTVPDSEAVIDEPAPEPAATEAAAAPPRSTWDRFARELKDSQAWIEKHEDAVGTIQILLLTFDTFDADVFYQFVANLERKNVDTERIQVFKTLTGNKEVYSVFYGEYASRSAAFSEIENLPPVLRETSPIPRSVGGIRQEIRRLEAGN